MSFSMNLDRSRHGQSRSFRRSEELSGNLKIIAAAFVIFCIFDYSPYGTGSVASGLGGAQHWVQGALGSLQIKR